MRDARYNLVFTLLAMGVVLIATSAVRAHIDLDPAIEIPVGPEPTGVAVGDFDADGDLDLATTIREPDKILILANDGAGHYTQGGTCLLPAESCPSDVAAGDFDGDGFVDLATTVRSPFGAVVIMTNTGFGDFIMTGIYEVGARPRWYAMDDIDLDGDLDLAVINRDANSVSVLYNSGIGTFIVVTVEIGAQLRGLTFVDFDGDLDLDLVVTNRDDRVIMLFANLGPAFQLHGSLYLGEVDRPDGVTDADVDGDGLPDLAVACSNQVTLSNHVAIFKGLGAGMFADPVMFPTDGLDSSQILAVDFNLDGWIDLATVNRLSNDISLLRNMGEGIFGEGMLFAVGAYPNAMATGNLDRDVDCPSTGRLTWPTTDLIPAYSISGFFDLVVANRESGSLSVLFNTSCIPCPTDVNDDGITDTQDLVQVILNWGYCPACPADVNDDNIVDVQDQIAVILGWGACGD